MQVDSKALPGASGESGLVFCPTCGNLLLVRQSGGMGDVLRFFCRTCPYAFPLRDQRLTITRTFGERRGRAVDDVLGGEEAWKDVEKTDARCPAENCNSRMAFFRQMQIRSADEPMTTFYRCVQCARQWKED